MGESVTGGSLFEESDGEGSGWRVSGESAGRVRDRGVCWENLLGVRETSVG